jgi:hypothetical protein
MIEYADFPPTKYFLRALKNCPQSAFLYTQIWARRGKNMSFQIDKKEIRKDYLVSPTLFRNLLTPLMNLNLVYLNENSDKFHIDILGPHLSE